MEDTAPAASSSAVATALGKHSPAAFALRASQRSRPHWPLGFVLAAVCMGATLDRFVFPAVCEVVSTFSGGSFWWMFWLAGCAASLVVWRRLWLRRRDMAAACTLLVPLALVGAAWHHANWYCYPSDEIGLFASELPRPICLEAVALESAERVVAPPPTPLRAIPGIERSRLLVRVARVRDGQGWRNASGTCLLSVEGHALWIRAGDRLRVFGQLSRPSPPLNPGEFDFAAYARSDRQLARVRSSSPESVARTSAGSAWSPRAVMDSLRRRAKERIHAMVGFREAGVAQAILLGDRGGLPLAETESYLETGTIHVLVVSGMNVAILAVGLLLIMRMGWLPRPLALGAVVAVVVGYMLLTKAEPPVVRATILATLGCVAAWVGRRVTAFNVLLLAALVVLILNPNDLFRAGPQLSFLAVAVLIWMSGWPWFRRFFAKQQSPVARETYEPPGGEVSEIVPAFLWVGWLGGRVINWSLGLLATSFVVWATSLPLVLFTFHIVSPISIPASLALWPLVTLAMWSGFFMLVLGWLIPPVGLACGTVCGWSLSGLEALVHWAEGVTYGHFWSPAPAWWWVLVFYAGLIAVMAYGRSMLALRWQVGLLAAWIVVGFVPPLVRGLNRDAAECSFVAVGHGACVVLRSPAGETLLYDAGAMGPPEYAVQSIASYLWHEGIQRIDGIVISHADVDHYNAVPGLLERFCVGAVYVSPVMFDEMREPAEVRGVHVLREAIDRAGVRVHEIWSGNRLQVAEDLRIEVLHPPRRGVIGSDNANSITLAVETAGRRLLLPGDLESPGLQEVTAEMPYHCDILLAPHHGSSRSDPPGFAAWCTPNWVVLSSGWNDDTDRVTVTYQRAGAVVLSTSQFGAIRFSIRSDGTLRPSVWRSVPPGEHRPARAAAETR
ncbi:MAG: ComEC/Rec2 family competence protein [Pirellulales bacterium]|nr:ComEC/Rec2 family competence protein [Pirellulales bacterium]